MSRFTLKTHVSTLSTLTVPNSPQIERKSTLKSNPSNKPNMIPLNIAPPVP